MNGRKWLRVGGLTAGLVLILCRAGSPGAESAAGHHPADAPATHNMLVVGEEAVYLSHLPMFQEEGRPPMPHRYQAILEVSFTKQEDYAKDRRAHPGAIYMLNPEAFVLPELAPSDPARKPLGSFKGKAVTRGHLEREGSVRILRDVDVSVRRVVHLREFDPKAAKPAGLEYLLFGKGQELFLAHLITAPPDFDQVLAVKLDGHRPTDEELAKGVPVVFPGTKNAAPERLKAKQRAKGELKAGNPATAREIQVEVGGELYFEEGELRVPPDFKPTPEETRAGFP